MSEKKSKASLARSTQRAEQLTLFQCGFFSEKPSDSRTLDLIDDLPFFQPGKSGKQKTPEPIVRTKEYDGHKIYFKTSPVGVAIEGKPAVLMVPAAREWFVERAIRKLAVQQNAPTDLLTDDRTRTKAIHVCFTLSQLRKELVTCGHGYKISEIKEALVVLRDTPHAIECLTDTSLHGKRVNIFTDITYNYKLGDMEGSRSYVSVMYHPIYSHYFLKGAFMPINYYRVMKLKFGLARWLTEKIARRYRGVNRSVLSEIMNFERTGKGGYNISLATILSEGGMENQPTDSNNVTFVEIALEEMSKAGVLHEIMPFKRKDKWEVTKSGRKRREGVVWYLFISKNFACEILDGLAEMKKIRNAAIK